MTAADSVSGSSDRWSKRVRGSSRPVRRRPGGATDGLVGAVADANRRGKTADWDGATPTTWVGLYVLCYRIVYDGATPESVEGARKFRAAVGWVTRFLAPHEVFGNPRNVADFVKFVWRDHEGKRAWGKDKGVMVKPPNFKAVFNRRNADAWLEQSAR